MNIEKLNSSRKKKTIVLVLVFLVVTITLILVTSMAKYKNVQSMDLASGTINYMPADIDIVSIQIENESGSYESSTTIPSSGYTLSNTSYCNVNGSKDTNVVLTYENGKVGATNISKKLKCYLYFDKKVSALDKIIGDTTGIQEKTSFTGIATASDTGIYSAPDDYGTSYYFRGLEGSLNNWVKFADSYWRIIRVNGNGTVRMIYSGAANGNPSSSNKIGDTTQIGTSMYNHTSNDNAYVGYMMGISLNGTDATTSNATDSNSTSYEQAHTNTYNSDAKKVIDGWYKINIDDKNLSKYIDNNVGFCNDRELSKGTNGYKGEGYGTEGSSYAPLGRLYSSSNWRTTQIGILKCTSKDRDLFTVSSANIGNKKLTYPVGMITSDEVLFAGGFGNSNNIKFYLYTNQDYWTMSPYFCNGTHSFVSRVTASGHLDYTYVISKDGLRPVINLRADTQFTGNGNETDPFVVI